MTATHAETIDGARSVALAAGALVRSIRTGRDLETAIDRLELQAQLSIGVSEQGFDAGHTPTPNDEDLLTAALSQLSIGTTLLAAESVIAGAEPPDRLGSEVARLERTADALEREDAPGPRIQGFDTGPAGEPLGLASAAHAALDEMAEAASTVLTAVLDSTLKPLVSKVPEDVRDMISGLNLDLPGRLAKWGMRAVRRALDVLSQLIGETAVERVRSRVDDVLARLGLGEDAAVLTGWVIGADSVRADVGAVAGDESGGDLVRELADLSARFGKLCRLLSAVAVAVTGVVATLSLLQVALPQAGVLTAAALALVTCAVVLLGRDFTGATDIPGPVLGVRLLIGADRDARA